MSRTILTILAFCLATVVFAQSAIKLEEAKDHIGDSVLICGKVFSARYFETSKGSPTLLNLGAAFPHQLLTVVIWEDLRKQMPAKPEDYFLNKEICITGKIELYKDKPQMVIRQLGQLVCTNCN